MSDFQSSTTSLASTVPETPSPAAESLWYRGVRYYIVQRPLRQHGTRPTNTSWIGGHGREARSFNDTSKKHFQCGLCGDIFSVGSTTHHAAVHLTNKHGIRQEGDTSTTASPSTPVNQQLQSQPQRTRALYTDVVIAKFRHLLLRWICCMHIALSVVEDQSFRHLILYICPALSFYLVKAGNTIRAWILQEFERQKDFIRGRIRRARSKVHIGIDCWTSGNSDYFVAIVAHFLDDDLVNQSIVIGLKRLWYSHSAENIAPVVAAVLKDMLDLKQLGVFIADNENTNDAVFRLILAELEPSLPASQVKLRRARCLLVISSILLRRRIKCPIQAPTSLPLIFEM